MSYLPQTLLGLKNWSATFAAYITAGFANVGLTTGQQATYNGFNDAFSDALDASTNPATRTPVTVAATEEAKQDLLAQIYLLVPIIQAFAGTTDTERATLGLTIRKTTRTPVPTPTAVPVLSANRLVSLQVTLRVNDVENNSNRFPPNTVGANIYQKIGGVAPTSISQCVFVGRMTKRFLVVDYDGANANSPVHYIAAYVTRTNKEGPASSVLSTTVPQ